MRNEMARREVLAISSEHTNNLVEVTNRRGDQKRETCGDF